MLDMAIIEGMLTPDDHDIFRRLMSVQQQARYHKQDRRDAFFMLNAQFRRLHK